MNGIEAARLVVSEKQAHLLRPRKDGGYDVKPIGVGSARGWFLLDLFSASAIVKLYDIMSDEHKTLYAQWPVPKQAVFALRF
jgi:hypothetical protein